MYVNRHTLITKTKYMQQCICINIQHMHTHGYSHILTLYTHTHIFIYAHITPKFLSFSAIGSKLKPCTLESSFVFLLELNETKFIFIFERNLPQINPLIAQSLAQIHTFKYQGNSKASLPEPSGDSGLNEFLFFQASWVGGIYFSPRVFWPPDFHYQFIAPFSMSGLPMSLFSINTLHDPIPKHICYPGGREKSVHSKACFIFSAAFGTSPQMVY